MTKREAEAVMALFHSAATARANAHWKVDRERAAKTLAEYDDVVEKARKVLRKYETPSEDYE